LREENTHKTTATTTVTERIETKEQEVSEFLRRRRKEASTIALLVEKAIHNMYEVFKRRSWKSFIANNNNNNNKN